MALMYTEAANPSDELLIARQLPFELPGARPIASALAPLGRNATIPNASENAASTDLNRTILGASTCVTITRRLAVLHLLQFVLHASDRRQRTRNPLEHKLLDPKCRSASLSSKFACRKTVVVGDVDLLWKSRVRS